MNEDTHYYVLRLVESRPEISQRELAAELGVSLGKANYCLKALIDKGWVKARNFKNSNSKWSYAYLLTPKGIQQKTRITARFLNRKMAEYEALKKEIADLQHELNDNVS
jgi:EPS-associated MarR family transcriptional regulator